jgi:hypothetical protein
MFFHIMLYFFIFKTFCVLEQALWAGENHPFTELTFPALAPSAFLFHHTLGLPAGASPVASRIVAIAHSTELPSLEPLAVLFDKRKELP